MILFPYEAPDPARERQDLIAYAEAGHAPYQRALAHCYRIGDELTQQDYAEAIRWYRRAAEQGDAAAQNDLGSMYLNGMGVPKNATEAARWYRKSAEQGLAMGMFHYALRCLHGDGVERLSLPEIEREVTLFRLMHRRKLKPRSTYQVFTQIGKHERNK